MRLKSVFISVAFIGVLGASATAATACSYSGNSYELWQREPLHLLVDRSSSIELIEVSVANKFTCPARPSRLVDDETWEAWERAAPEECADMRLPGATLTGSVTERFKGNGEMTFPLLANAHGGDARLFSDLRALSDHDAASIRAAEASRADRGHHGAEFWLQGDVGFQKDGTDSCGGSATMVPGMTYVTFRNVRGEVIAAEPVSARDDELVRWLRRTRSDSAARPARRFTPEEALGVASALALVRVQRCERDAEWDETIVFARPLRGTSDSVFPRGEEVDAQGGQRTFYLDDWLEHRNLVFRPLDVLIVEVEGGGRVWIPPMPAVVRDGIVTVADLFPGVPLTGPERITVEEAFAAFDSNRAD